MKTPLCITALLLLCMPALTQQSGKRPPSELSQLRQNYISSLKDLLQRCINENNFAGVAAVSRELDKTTAAAPRSSASRSPVGRWRWADGESVTTLTPDGTAANAQNQGVWHWIGESRRKLQIHWKDGVVDTLAVSPDGMTLHGINSLGQEFVAHRMPAEETVERAVPKG